MSEQNRSVIRLCTVVAVLMIAATVFVPAPALASEDPENVDPRPCLWVDPGGPGVIVDIRCILERIPILELPP